jgi:hypothetical protein
MGSIPSRLARSVRINDLGLGRVDAYRRNERHRDSQREDENRLSHLTSPKRVIVASIADWLGGNSRRFNHISVSLRHMPATSNPHANSTRL